MKNVDLPIGNLQMFCYINLTDCRNQGKSVHEEHSEKGSESISPLRLQI